jgi:hypothetical protein
MGWVLSLYIVLVIGDDNNCGGRPNGKVTDAEGRSWMLVDINKDFAAFYMYLL